MRSPLQSVTVRAPAKLNLFLSVGPVREDGYHELVTVFQALGLYDELTVSPADSLSLVVTGDTQEGVPDDGSNLAVRAVQALAAEAGIEPNVSLLLNKSIPVAGGCAGGSADAAAALVACAALWGLGWDETRLAQIGAELGSDVPFSLHGRTALGTGRGERLTPVLADGTFHWVLALPATGLSTPRVYAEHDRLHDRVGVDRTAPDSDASPVLAALRSGSAPDLGRALRNDLQPAALSLQPGLVGVLAAGQEAGALGAIVSGSGPTVAFLARDGEHAAELAEGLEGDGLCRATCTAESPVAGATVVRTH